jgi:hypothetical protein
VVAIQALALQQAEWCLSLAVFRQLAVVREPVVVLTTAFEGLLPAMARKVVVEARLLAVVPMSAVE